MPNIEKTIHIAAPIEQVWAALTDPTAIGDWMEDDSIEVDLRRTLPVLRQGDHWRVYPHRAAPPP